MLDKRAKKFFNMSEAVICRERGFEGDDFLHEIELENLILCVDGKIIHVWNLSFISDSDIDLQLNAENWQIFLYICTVRFKNDKDKEISTMPRYRIEFNVNMDGCRLSERHFDKGRCNCYIFSSWEAGDYYISKFVAGKQTDKQILSCIDLVPKDDYMP